MKKALIITYYWPPSGGAGVQRWLKFVKYLREFGWEPVIYTPLEPDFPIKDYTLAADIPDDVELIRKPIWEPYSFYKKIVGGDSTPKIDSGTLNNPKSPGIISQLFVWIRGNLFIPDARKFWIKPSIRFLLKYLREHHVNVIISTGPPHSMHLIALKLKEQLHIPWLADFRDPWTDIDYYKEMKISNYADKKHKELEMKTITTCDAMVVVSPEMKINYEMMGGKNVQLITNGFDPDDLGSDQAIMDTRFSISHIGALPPSFNLKGLWQVLSELRETLPGFEKNLVIRLVGKVDDSVIDDLSAKNLEKLVELPGYVTHDKAANFMKQSAVLLLVINQNSPNARGILTGKFFEYLAARRPILAIGPTDGSLAGILEESGAGKISVYNDVDQIKKMVMDLYDKYLHNKLINSGEGIDKFTRKRLTAQLAEVLNDIIN